MGARRRLDRLEAVREAARPHEVPPHVLLYLKHADNARRELNDLEPVPLTPEEEELERRTERDALENLIPMLRSDLGWQGEEAQALLDQWERDARKHAREER